MRVRSGLGRGSQRPGTAGYNLHARTSQKFRESMSNGSTVLPVTARLYVECMLLQLEKRTTSWLGSHPDAGLSVKVSYSG